MELATVHELQVKYKRTSPVYPQITNAREMHKLFAEIFTERSFVAEEFYCLYLNRLNRPLTYKLISQGGISGTVVDPRIIFGFALAIPTCTSIVLAHNHPSGGLKPSEEDIRLTRKLSEGAKLLEFRIVDHLIMDTNSGGFFSFADEGLL